MFELKAKKLDSGAKLPLAAHPGDLGCDLFALEKIVIPAGQQAKVRTGIAVQFPAGWGGIIKDRSSMASKRVYTSAGVIDAGYRGEILVLMRNDNPKDFAINQHDKIAQMIPCKAQKWSVMEAEELTDSARSDGGFGSTGKK